jgi:low temperature requirement protein LtrA
VSVPGKRVSWVEAYLDLVFVLAVSRLAHVIEAKPEMASVWTALGLFVVLWWTWIGFAVLYNRRGRDARPQRLLFLAGSVPAGVAAVAIAPAAEGHSAAFALSMALTRLVLAGAQAEGEGWRDVLSRRISRAYLIAAALFVVSIWVPEPGRYVLWAIAVAGESGVLLRDDRRAVREARQTHDVAALGPIDPGEALDPHHFAERFGLFLIILLGEVLVSAGDLPVGDEGATLAGWGSVAAAMVLAAALWWLYFDSAADFNLRVLELSGGSPAMARALFAAGHMLPAFALILIASGLSLLIEGDAPHIAYVLSGVGLGIYLAGTRVFPIAHSRGSAILRVALLVLTFFLARIAGGLGPREYVWLLMAWAVMCAALASRPRDELESGGQPGPLDGARPAG